MGIGKRYNMKKVKCDKCGKKDYSHNMKIVGKPKHKMSPEELKQNNTYFGDNKSFEKRYCKDCLLTIH